MSWRDLGKEFQKLRTEFRGSLPAKLRREVHTMAGSRPGAKRAARFGALLDKLEKA